MAITVKPKIIENIRIARLKKGYSQEYMAHRLGISQRAYSKLENGEILCKGNYLIKIAVVLNISITDLLISSEKNEHLDNDMFRSEAKRTFDLLLSYIDILHEEICYLKSR